MLSVITITFNNFSELKRTIDPLMRTNYESIIINGGSCLETKNFLHTFKGISVSERDNGISDAFNKGFQLATGEYITFLNSGDTLIDERYYAEALQVFSRNSEVDFIYADISFLDVYAGEIRVRSNNKLPNMPFMHPTLIVRRNVFQKIGLFDLNLRIAMDLDFVYRMVRSGARGHYISRMVVRMDGAGVSSSKHFAHFAEVNRVIIKNRDYSLSSFRYILKRGSSLLVKKLLLLLGGEAVIGIYRKIRYGIKDKT